MRTFRFWAGSLMMVICMSMLSACSDDDDVSTGALVGLWQSTHWSGYDAYDDYYEDWDEPIDEEDSSFIKFNSDGTLSTWEYGDEENAVSAYYELDGDRLIVSSAWEDVYIVKTLNGNTLQLEYREGDNFYELLTFKRR